LQIVRHKVRAQRIHRATLNGHRYSDVWAINLDKFPFAEQLKDALDITGTTAGI
jgi:hypothetical protein